MQVTLNLTVAFIVLFIVHTIFTHLLNWLTRESPKFDFVVFSVFLNIVELVICIGFIINWTT